MIAVVVPSIRKESYKKFLRDWDDLFSRYDVKVVKVEDGKRPRVNGKSVREVMGEYLDLIYNFNDGVRNLGFAYVAKYLPEVDYILSLDDDTAPYGDTIAKHIEVLTSDPIPTSWISTADKFMRGFPYNKRKESEIVMSHGTWIGVADWDAPTQLVQGNIPVSFYRGSVPKGVLYPHCAMNFMFKRKVLPYIYQAPMFGDLNRFADIWGGIECKKDLDRLNWAVVTGYSNIRHERASNVYQNIIKEAKGLQMNENYGEDPYFKFFFRKRKRWMKFIKSCDSQS